MNPEKIKEIVANIKEVFINEHEYEMFKRVDEVRDSKNNFLGDFVSFLMIDKNITPPTFYSVVSPFDLVSKKDPQHALVWQGGKLLLNIDYTDYAAMRTGAMDGIALKALQIDSLTDKKILLFGTGRTAKWSIRTLSAMFDDLEKVNYINSSNTRSEEFESFCKDLKITAVIGNKADINQYDIILCHTNTKQPILNTQELGDIKNGAIITTFLGSDNEHGEVSDDYYNSEANIVLDWKQNMSKAKDIVRSKIPESEILFLKDLLAQKLFLDENKKYTIFRFIGTPMQNLGVLQSLIV